MLDGLDAGELELWLAVGDGSGDVAELVGLGVGGLILVLVGLGVGCAEELWLVVGLALAEVLPEVLPVAFVLPEALAELLGEPAGLSAESRRIAALGRLEHAPVTIGEVPPSGPATEAPKTSGLDARSMKPVSALSATGLTSCALTGITSSWTSEPE